jgi:hypothetical protein
MWNISNLGRIPFGVVAIVLATCAPLAGQVHGPGRVVPLDLVVPLYPPIAVSARVTGDLTVVVRVRPDGSVAGAEPVSGTPLLQEVAVRAAMASRFECRECDGVSGSHTITYSFQFDLPPVPPELGSESGSRVHVTAKSPVIEILFSSVSVRSVKCLYLWHCGSEWGGMEFYNYRVRSGRCAWLWKCGWRRRQEASCSTP